jgi:hypothetical protein
MIRTIFIPENDIISLYIPKEYIGTEVEIIVFPKTEIYENEIVRKKMLLMLYP